MILEFYTSLVSTNAYALRSIYPPVIRSGILMSADMARKLIKPIEENEIWRALSSIGDTKAPCMDGFNAYFFKTSWRIVKGDIIDVILEFFTTCKMFLVVNCSLVPLIPKSSEAKTIKDMRPISCCNTIYKIISKILTTRLGEVISTIIDENQSTFIPRRIIHDNIMMTQELVRGYGRKNISPRCMVQMDIQKVYDIVEWKTLTHIMYELGFPQMFINWILACVTTVLYRFSINGVPCLHNLKIHLISI